MADVAIKWNYYLNFVDFQNRIFPKLPAWFFPSTSPSTLQFRNKWAFTWKSLVVFSIIHFTFDWKSRSFNHSRIWSLLMDSKGGVTKRFICAFFQLREHAEHFLWATLPISSNVFTLMLCDQTERNVKAGVLQVSILFSIVLFVRMIWQLFGCF